MCRCEIQNIIIIKIWSDNNVWTFECVTKYNLTRFQMADTSVFLAFSRIFFSSFRFLEITMAMWTGSSWNRSCRFLLILRMLCCSRKLLSRAKRPCWSSSCVRRSWNLTVARESWYAAVSLKGAESSSLSDLLITDRVVAWRETQKGENTLMNHFNGYSVIV